jgi:hypothetical protein
VQITKDGNCANACSGKKHTKFGPILNIDDKWEFRVSRYGGGHIHMLRCLPDNGGSCTDFFHTPWDPEDYWDSFSSLFSAEIDELNDSIPGKPSNRTNFSNIHERTPDGNWYRGQLDKIPIDNGGWGNTHNRPNMGFNMVDDHEHFQVWEES